MNKYTFVIIFVLLFPAVIFSQKESETQSKSLQPSGYWSGWIQRGKKRYNLSAEIKETNGKWSGSFDLLSMGYYRHELLDVKIKEDVQKHLILSIPLPIGSLELIGNLQENSVIKGSVETITLVKGEWKSLPEKGHFEIHRRQKPSLPYNVQEVNFSSGSVNLSGALYMPRGKGPFPAAVFISGSGDTTRGEGGFIADRLARAGIAVFAYDKRGVGASTGNWKTTGFDDLGSDATAALNKIRQFHKISASKTGFICQSQGCWIAPVAIRNGAKANFLVSISGPTVSVADEDLDYYRVTLNAAGFSNADIEQAFDLVRAEHKVTLGFKTPTDLEAVMKKYETTGWFQFLKYKPMSPTSKLREFVRNTLPYDPEKDLNSLRIPSLWLYGTGDIVIPVPGSISRLKELRAQPKPELIILEGADHALSVWDQGELPEVAQDFPGKIINWIKAK